MMVAKGPASPGIGCMGKVKEVIEAEGEEEESKQDADD